jgi:DNA modification methylase/transcriptional regulator with XRE-family HTH domain
MIWSTHTAIRTRREQISLSQSDLARQMGVTKSLLSHIEAGKRQPTEEQLAVLSTVLQIPPDLLLLGSGRMPEDVRGAFTQNAAEAVAAVRERTEAHVVSCPRLPQCIPLPRGKAAALPKTTLPERINVQKTSTSYRAHSYHTKVPPEAITPFIRAFTRPGDTILDPFCGSGMTGVAALMEGRNALLSDLSPAAVHIARNYTTPCDPRAFAAALARVEKAVAPTIAWLYRPFGADRIVEYTTWSDVYSCPSCRTQIVYWDVVQRDGGITGDRLACPRCGTPSRKASLEWVGEVPVESHTSAGSNRIDTHHITREELALIEGADAAPVPYWTPTVSFGPEREMWRAAHRAMAIDDTTGFFTRRNLHALAALRHAIIGNAEGRVREALLFAFTAALNRASKRYQWNVKRPTNVMTGTLYISSLRYEWNVWSLFRRKAADVLRYYAAFPNTQAKADVFQRSATDLDCLPDRSIDMVFMDPPFGSNIFYADSSLLWEAWLGQLTDEAAEIVVNKHRARAVGGKNVEDYRDLMRKSFEHAGRVLKTDGRAILAFSNSDDQIWSAIQTALRDAGFKTASVHLLNKGQPSIKGVKGVTGKEHVTTFDLVLCLEHTRTVPMNVPFPPPSTLVDQGIRDALRKGSSRTDEIYSVVIRAVVEAHYSVTGITMPMIAARCAELGGREHNGRWMLRSAINLPDQPKDFVAGYFADPKALPQSNGSAAISKGLAKVRVTGGRNSALYLAHSYHTKVPPEAIAPFIEHYTKPGDVVLDPFCGSGMTGVAASLAGRRAILNDLSPAAVHLAWNHTRPCDPDDLAAGFAAVEARVAKRFRSLYKTAHTDKSEALIHWTLWSTRHKCPKCAHRFLLWEVMDQKTGRLGSTIGCPRCRKSLHRSELKKLGSEPAWIAYETKDGKRHEKTATPDDIKKALSFQRKNIEVWYPETPLGTDREMFIRCALQLHGIETIADFYTPRNLEALGLLWQEIMAVPDERVRRALAFAFTNTAWHGTRMRRFNARGGQRPLTGTLYIPQLSSEANVLEVMRNKIAQLQRYYRSYRPHGAVFPALLLSSATDLSTIPDGSIDYVFTDPPFGSNIFYADCNLIWESWLGRLTDSANEAVVNRSLALDKGGKSLATYAALIRGAMQEIARVLKPSGWATVVFHNTDAAVWQAIRDAADETGFTFHEAASLDRQQQSHKGYKGRSGSEDVAHFDVVFNLRKTSSALRSKAPRTKNAKLDLSKMVASIVKDRQIAQHGLQGIHAEVMRQMASHGGSNFVDYAEVRTIWERLVIQEDVSEGELRRA